MISYIGHIIYDQIYVDFFWWRYLKSRNTNFKCNLGIESYIYLFIFLKSENNEYDKLHLQLSSHEKRTNIKKELTFICVYVCVCVHWTE